MNSKRITRNRIAIAIALIVVFLSTTASSCSSPSCDLLGPDTAVTTCIYGELTK